MAYFAALREDHEAWRTNWDKSLAKQDRLEGQLLFDEKMRFYDEGTRISDHSTAEITRIADHFVGKGVHDDGSYPHLYKALLAAPVAGGLLIRAWHCYDQCKNFNPTAQERRNAYEEKQSQRKKIYQHACVEASLIAQKSPAGLAVLGGSEELANQVIAIKVASFLAGNQESEIPIKKNDIGRYRSYTNAGIFFGVTGCIAATISLYQFGKFINYPRYPSFVPNEFVPNKV